MTKRYAVHNLRCAGCAARIEDAILGLPGVKSVAINLDSARLRVEGEQPELNAMIRLADAIEPGTLFSLLDENEPLPENNAAGGWFPAAGKDPPGSQAFLRRAGFASSSAFCTAAALRPRPMVLASWERFSA